MSVINTRHDYHSDCRDSHKCSVCDDGLDYPFICWVGEGAGLYICGPCCRRIKDGLMADLIQLAATMDLRALKLSAYTNDTVTLVRSSRQKLEAEAEAKSERRRQEEQAAMIAHRKIVSIKKDDPAA
jgi:hypothetical protein